MRQKIFWILICAFFYYYNMNISYAASLSREDFSYLTDTAKNAARDLCEDVKRAGSTTTTEIKAGVDARLTGVIRKLAQAGLDTSATIKSDVYDSVLQKDLPIALENVLKCRAEVFSTIFNKLKSDIEITRGNPVKSDPQRRSEAQLMQRINLTALQSADSFGDWSIYQIEIQGKQKCFTTSEAKGLPSGIDTRRKSRMYISFGDFEGDVFLSVILGTLPNPQQPIRATIDTSTYNFGTVGNAVFLNSFNDSRAVFGHLYNTMSMTLSYTAQGELVTEVFKFSDYIKSSKKAFFLCFGKYPQ